MGERARSGAASPFGRTARRSAETLGEAFTSAAESLGLTVDGSGQAELTYLAGAADPEGGQELGSDLFLSAAARRQALVRHLRRPRPVAAAARGPGVRRAVSRRYGRRPGRYAAYGYEAMAVVLDSIARAGDEGSLREAVIDAFFDTSDRDSVLGTYSIDEVGETTLDRLTGYRLEGDRAKPVAELSASND